ncbi:MAG TPA: Co2+/Mg2+ efflux protein ApaG [Candidatus Polarisedimenticolaceae bacterium]|nr:Co2+/Mg2+ efflux protein ApaG [Candidatus Polarisedimenticolaceae bacterium]
MPESDAITRGVRVHVVSRHDPDRSDPENGQWFFLYTIRITNEGDRTVRLLSRHWIITDSSGKVEEVRGPGVVGHQPTLAPGESFEYTSGCPLETAFGTMHGSYEMVVEGGGAFRAEIAPFALGLPYSIN